MLSTPTALSPTSLAATSTCNAAGQPRGSQVASDFNPVSISCGYRVSCAEMLGVDEVSRQAGDASWDEPGTSWARA